MLEVKVGSSEQASVGASILYDYGDGFSNKGKQKILLLNRKEQKRILFLHPGVKRFKLRLDDTNTSIELSKFCLVKTTEAFACSRMRKKLGLSALDDKAVSPFKLWKHYSTHFRSIYNSSYLANIEPSYNSWITKVERPSIPSEMIVKKRVLAWKIKPLISILLPTYNTPEKYLRACIDSVLNQSYSNWELCIADDASLDESVKYLLESYQESDDRIKVFYGKDNSHISQATNNALSLATGDYIAFLDHDDMLAKDALYFVADAIVSDQGYQLIYSDEDWIDENGKRITPHFKSDWNRDLFYSHNYITHLAVYKSSLIAKVNGLRLGVEGSQDYDLILRCLSHIEDNEIHHIPRILYHWRAVEGSTALAAGEKSYTVEAGRKSLQDHFDSSKLSSVVVESSQIDNTYRVRWPVPQPQPKVCLIIPTKNMKELTEVAVTSILKKTTYDNYEILIVDNGSTEEDALAYFDDISAREECVTVLKYNKPFNYSAINNYAVESSSSDYVGLINNDIKVISPDWLSEMVSHASREDVGCVGAKLYYKNDTIQHAGIIMGLGGAAAHSHRHFPKEHPGYIGRLKMVQNLSGVTAACLVVKRAIYNQVGGLDEKNLKVAYNDVDFCLKVREAGYRNLWTPFAELYHYESISRGYEDSPEKKARFYKETKFLVKKWGEKISTDPYYNENLTHSREDFSIRSNG
jgi:glycosyltransferase involved in cell wall biosynthesis